MISLDELNATIKRMEIINNNSDSYEEQFLALNIKQSLTQMYNQLFMLTNRPEFKSMVDEYVKSLNTEN